MTETREPKTIKVQDVTVLISFSEKSNASVPSLIMEILKAAYIRQHAS